MDCSPGGSSVHGDSPSKHTGVGCHALLQGIFLTQGSNWGLPHWRWILYCLSHQGSRWILEWVAYPFSGGSSRLRNWTGVSCIADEFFTSRATTESQWCSRDQHEGQNSQECCPEWRQTTGALYLPFKELNGTSTLLQMALFHLFFSWLSCNPLYKTLMEKDLKKNVCVGITESLCRTAVINTTL